MNQFALLLLATLLRGSLSSPQESALLQHLFHPENATYDLLTTPIRNSSEFVNVELRMTLRKIIALDDVREVLTLQYYLHYEWKDYRLKWNSKHFWKLGHIQVQSSKVWTPQLLVRNNAKQTPIHEITPQSDYVNIRSTGDCTWDPRYELAATQCDVDVKWFPFDEQKCNVTFASWLLSKDNIKLAAEAKLDGYLKSDDWTLVEITANTAFYSNGIYPMIYYTLYLRRKPIYYIINIIVPCCFIAFIAAATFVLPPNSNDRLGLTVTIVLAVTVYQLIVNDKLPTTSNTPVINMFFFFSIAMSVCSVLLTMVVIRMNLHAEHKPLVPMPRWLKYLFCKILATWLCMKPMRSRLPKVDRHSNGVAINNVCSKSCDRAEHEPSLEETTDNDPVKKLLARICDLLEAQDESRKQQAYESEKDEKIMNEWHLAAAVLDRICAIGFAIIFAVGTITFITIIARHRN